MDEFLDVRLRGQILGDADALRADVTARADDQGLPWFDMVVPSRRRAACDATPETQNEVRS